jgi:PAS domain S-box-containing protein
MDMSERERAEQALRESEKTLRSLVDALPGIAFRARNDDDWTVEEVSPQVEELFGYTREDFLEGRITWAQLIHPGDAGMIRESVALAMSERRPYRIEYRVRARDGTEMWLWEQGHGVYDGDEAVRIEGFAMDVTARKAAEDVLRESEARFRALLESNSTGMLVVDEGGRIVFVNQALARLLGYEPDELLGEPVELLVPDGLRGGHVAHRERYAAHPVTRPMGHGLDLRARRKDGTSVAVEIGLSSFLSEGERLVTAVVTDITTRKRAEDALRESEERLRTMAESSPATIFLTDARGACTFVSRAWQELTGQDTEQALGYGWAERIHEEDRSDVVAAFRRALQTGAPHLREFRVRRPDGAERWVLARSEPRLDEDGRFAGYGGSVVDITDLRVSVEAERSGRERSEALRAAGAALAAASTEEEVARAAVEGFEALGAAASTLYVLDAAGGELALASYGSVDPVSLAGWERVPLRPGLPGPEAVLSGAPVFLRSRAEAVARYPSLEEVVNLRRSKAFAALPLSGATGRLGFVFLAYDEEERLRAHDEHTLMALADQTAQALERAQLYRLTERAHEQTAQRYGLVAERAPIGIFETAADGEYVFVNQRWCELAGLGGEEALGRGWLAAVHPDDRARVESSWDERVGVNEEYADAFRLLTPAGAVRWIRCRALPVTSDDGADAAGYIGVLEDVTMQREAEKAAQALAAERRGHLRAEQLRLIGEALARGVSVRDVAAAVVEHVAAALGSPSATITVLDAERSELEVVGSLGIPAELSQRYGRFPLVTPLPSAVVVQTGAPLWIERWEDAPREVEPPPLLTQHVRAVAALPLVVGGRPVGALFLGYPHERRFTDEERELLLAVAGLCSEALGRVRLYEAERESRALAERERDRVDAWQRLSAALAIASDVAAVTDAVIEHAREVIGSVTVAVVLLEEGRPMLQIEREVGYPAGVIDHLRDGIPLEANVPVAEVTRTGSGLYFPSMDSVDVRFPHMRGIYESVGKAGAVLPLSVGRRRLGGIVLVFPEVEQFDEARVGELEAFARLCSQAFDRARLFEAEERALEHTRRLHALTAALSGAVTAADVGAAFFEQALPALGMDGGALVLVSPDRSRVQLVAQVGWPDDVAARIDGVSIDAGFALCEAARTGEIVRVEDRDAWAARYPESAATFADYARSALALPLFGGSDPVGAIGLTGPSEGPLGPGEMGLLITMADQVAQALERARLFERESQARSSAERRERLLRHRDEQLRLVHAAAGMGTWEWNPDTDVARWSPETHRLFGIPEHEPDLTRRWRENVHPDDLAAVLAALGEAAEHGRSSMEYRYQHPARGLLWIRWEAARLADERRITGVSVDVTDRRREEERQRMLAELGAALEEAESSRARMQRLAELVAADLADYATVELSAGDGNITLAAAAGRDAAAVARLRALRQRHRLATGAPSGIARVLATGDPDLIEDIGGATADVAGGDEGSLPFLRDIHARSYMAVPLRARGGTAGALVLIRTEPGVPYRRDDLAFASEIASRAALAIEAARVYERDHEIAVSLQQALLPPALDELAGLAVAARYEAGHEHLQIGGDWYDAVPLPDGRILIAVGDVVGRGLPAAAAMSRLQTALAALAPSAEGPADLVERLERFATEVAGAEFATVAAAMLDPDTGELRYATAGHPPPLLVLPDGETLFLDDAPSAPLCGLGPMTRPEGRASLEAGALLVLYTDGLIERRGQMLDVGLERLARAASAARAGAIGDLADGILTELTAGERLRDDIALLCVRLEHARDRRLVRRYPARPDQLSVARRALREWLAEVNVPEAERPDVVLAVGEALANAVEHAYWRTAPGAVEIDASCPRDGELVIRIADEGNWRDPQAPGDRGRGLAIMEELTDSLETKTSRGGTIVTLRRRIGAVSR